MKFKKFLTLAFLLGSLLVMSLILIEHASKNLGVEDSSALFGGKLESGYLYAGYLIAVEPDSKVTTCGVAFIDDSTAVTAAHCIIKGAAHYLGTGEFKLSLRNNFEVLYAEQNPQWNTKTYKDIAVIKLSDKVTNLTQFASQSSPVQGCNYVVVGYGMNEDSVSGSLNNKKRKSTEICIEDILADEVFFKGSGGGICYGDSGSPVFEKNTNKLVGVVSSILVPENFQGTNYCSINNRGVMVRIDNNEKFIADFQNRASQQNCTGSSCIAQVNQFCSAAQGISCASGLACVNNACVRNTDIPQLAISTEIISSSSSKSILETISETLNINFNSSEGILLGVILISLAIVLLLLFKFIFF